jgi:hypothetical protein
LQLQFTICSFREFVPFSILILVYREVPKMFRHCGYLVLVTGLGLLGVSGCGGRGTSSATDVSGKVSFKGAPVTGGSIQFHPKQGGGAYPGTINSDGTFSFKGIPFSGEVIVTIETESIKNSPAGLMKRQTGADPAALKKMMESMQGGKGSSSIYVQIPAKYGNPKSSPLTEILKQGSETRLDLVLNE